MNGDNSRTLVALKCAADADQIALPIKNPNGDVIGRLVPLTHSLCADSDIVFDLYSWRKKTISNFLTVFEPTIAKTQGYLTDLVLTDPNRILFLVMTASGKRIGNIGLCGVTDTQVEVDNVIRGEAAPSQFMDNAHRALLEFAFVTLEVDTVFLRVLADNERARISYERLGYSVTNVQRLRREDTTDGFRLLIDEHAGDYGRLLRMELSNPNRRSV